MPSHVFREPRQDSAVRHIKKDILWLPSQRTWKRRPKSHMLHMPCDRTTHPVAWQGLLL